MSLVALGRGGSIWEWAWGEFGWLPVRLVSSAALDWPPSSASWGGGRSQSVVLALSAACPHALTKDGDSLPSRTGIRGCQAALCNMAVACHGVTGQAAQLQEEGQTRRSPLAWRHCSRWAVVSAWAEVLLAESHSLFTYSLFLFFKIPLQLTEFWIMRSECLIPCMSCGIKIIMRYT